MKTRKIALALLLLGLALQNAFAQSTAFTYHGRLGKNGAAANGDHDMQFVVYTTPAGNQVVTGPLSLNNVPVNNGVFTARLDFGAGVFTGAERWLEVRVRRAGEETFEILSPRHELTSSPYAIRALSAGSADQVSNGSVVKSLNNLRDDVSLSAGANITLTPNGNGLTIAAVGGGGSGVWSVLNNNAYFNAGNVGIGTDNPSARLYVVSQTAAAADNSATFYAPLIGPYASHIHYGTAGDWFIRSASGSGKVILQDSGGLVGIGTTTPATKLTVFTPWLNHGIEHTDGSVRLSTYIDGTGGWLGTISNHKLHFFVNNGTAKMTVDTAGNVGIGTTSPATKLDVAGDTRTTRLVLRGDPLAPANAAVLCEDPNVLNFVPFNTAVGQPLNVIARQLTITGGADFAEPFTMSHSGISPGSVVVIDENSTGSLKLSTQAYDTRVAGVVSGANGIKPGISLRQEGVLDEGENVALSGRVYVKADAAFGAIKPGDLLTTSQTPGHAMKVSEHAKAQGAILGKAMTALEAGQGTVLILVTLQ